MYRKDLLFYIFKVNWNKKENLFSNKGITLNEKWEISWWTLRNWAVFFLEWNEFKKIEINWFGTNTTEFKDLEKDGEWIIISWLFKEGKNSRVFFPFYLNVENWKYYCWYKWIGLEFGKIFWWNDIVRNKGWKILYWDFDFWEKGEWKIWDHMNYRIPVWIEPKLKQANVVKKLKIEWIPNFITTKNVTKNKNWEPKNWFFIIKSISNWKKIPFYREKKDLYIHVIIEDIDEIIKKYNGSWENIITYIDLKYDIKWRIISWTIECKNVNRTSEFNEILWVISNRSETTNYYNFKRDSSGKDVNFVYIPNEIY